MSRVIGFANLENSLCWGALSLGMRLAAASRFNTDRCEMESDHSIRNLFRGVDVVELRGSQDVEVGCLITDSRRVVPGSLFFAISGLHSNGNDFIEEAIDRGAVGIVSEQPSPSVPPVAFVQVADVRATLATISKRFYRSPDEELGVIGVTGTNGKTTVTTVLQHLLQKEAGDVGLIGTVQYNLGRRTLPSYKTTPEALDLYAMLDQMRQAGCRRAVMEVSSHGIVQKRVQGMKMEAVAFLNLTQDHIDYHGDMEAYFEAKARLFTGASDNRPGVVLINRDDPYGERLLERIPAGIKAVSITVEPGTQADFMARNIQLSPLGARFDICHAGRSVAVETHLPGKYNVVNALAAIALATCVGEDLEEMAAKISGFAGVPGRMERVDCGQPFNVIVDYAHTDDALLNVLQSLREITTGRIFVVFGCGGDRDRIKRPRMTEVVQRLADHAWATADNPRREDLEQIFDDMRGGIIRPESITFEPSRRHAIGLALAAARAGDCVLIAGKGHETYQEFAHTVVPFDDRAVAREFLYKPDR